MSTKWDRELEKILNEDISIPDIVLKKKALAFEQIKHSKEKKSRFSYKQKIVAVLAGLFITGFVMFGESTVAGLKTLLFDDHGVQKAADYGYVQVVTSKNGMKDNGVEIKVTDVVYDSSKIALSLLLTFDDKPMLEHFNKLSMHFDLMDNKGRYIEKENLQEGLTKENAELLGAYDWSTKVNKERGEIKYTIIYYPMAEVGTIDTLYLNIHSIKLFSTMEGKLDHSSLKNGDSINYLYENQTGAYKEINGVWEGKISLDDKFKKGREVVYLPKAKNKWIHIESAKLLPTGMYITFAVDMNDKENEYLISKINEAILVDDEGKVYEQLYTGYNKMIDDDTLYKVKDFDVTSFDQVGDLKVIMKDVYGKDIEIDLMKAK